MLLKGIFMCGQQEVKNIVDSEHATYIVDLRAEATEGVVQGENVKWIHIPLIDGVPNQTEELKKAISFVATAHKEGKTIVLH
jgi:protein-tyrosine phosphatase